MRGIVGPHRTTNIADLFGLNADAILIDAPLAFECRSQRGEGRSPQHHYQCWTVEQLRELPVAKIAGPNCWVFSWIPLRSIDLVVPLFKAWAAQFSGTGLEWCKTNKNKPGFWMGSGYTTRKNFEVAWLGRIGQPHRADRGVPALIVAPRREHSRKPDEQYERIERLVGPGKTLVELFARQCWPGWHAWGDQLDRFAPNLETSRARRPDATCAQQLELLFAGPVEPVPIEDDPLKIPEFLRRTLCAGSAKIEIAIEEVVGQ
jgi:N6-adenosine-specific RNA methylase IME4